MCAQPSRASYAPNDNSKVPKASEQPNEPSNVKIDDDADEIDLDQYDQDLDIARPKLNENRNACYQTLNALFSISHYLESYNRCENMLALNPNLEVNFKTFKLFRMA